MEYKQYEGLYCRVQTENGFDRVISMRSLKNILGEEDFMCEPGTCSNSCDGCGFIEYRNKILYN